LYIIFVYGENAFIFHQKAETFLMKKGLYYSSILILGFIIFLLIISSSQYSSRTKATPPKKVKTKTTASKERLINQDEYRNFKFESLKDTSILVRGKKEFDPKSKKHSKRSKLAPFASHKLEDESTFYFILKNDHYEAYISSNSKPSLLYSTGTYFRIKDQGQTVYTFTSEIMTPFEAFYRFKNFEIAGAFYENVYSIDWTRLSADEKTTESWRLVELETKFYDTYSGKYFAIL
jgi:hypothetical protein